MVQPTHGGKEEPSYLFEAALIGNHDEQHVKAFVVTPAAPKQSVCSYRVEWIEDRDDMTLGRIETHGPRCSSASPFPLQQALQSVNFHASSIQKRQTETPECLGAFPARADEYRRDLEQPEEALQNCAPFVGEDAESAGAGRHWIDTMENELQKSNERSDSASSLKDDSENSTEVFILAQQDPREVALPLPGLEGFSPTYVQGAGAVITDTQPTQLDPSDPTTAPRYQDIGFGGRQNETYDQGYVVVNYYIGMYEHLPPNDFHFSAPQKGFLGKLHDWLSNPSDPEMRQPFPQDPDIVRPFSGSFGGYKKPTAAAMKLSWKASQERKPTRSIIVKERARSPLVQSQMLSEPLPIRNGTRASVEAIYREEILENASTIVRQGSLQVSDHRKSLPLARKKAQGSRHTVVLSSSPESLCHESRRVTNPIQAMQAALSTGMAVSFSSPALSSPPEELIMSVGRPWSSMRTSPRTRSHRNKKVLEGRFISGQRLQKRGQTTDFQRP